LNLCSADVDAAPLQLKDNGIDITGGTPGTNPACKVLVGQMNGITCEDPTGAGGLVQYAFPTGLAVKTYQPTDVNGKAAASCAPVYLSQEFALCFGGRNSTPAFSFAWVAGGEGLGVGAELWTPLGGSHYVEATFNVASPQLAPTTTAYIGGNAKNPKGGTWPGITVITQPESAIVGFGGPNFGVNGVNWKSNSFLSGADYSACKYCYAQVVTATGYYTDRNGLQQTATYDLKEPAKGVDNGFPYQSKNANGIFTDAQARSGAATRGDAPRFFVLPFGTSHYNLQATVWYMFQPPGGIWVPLASQVWSLNLTLNWTIGPLTIGDTKFGDEAPVIEDATVTIGGKKLANLPPTPGTPIFAPAPSFVNTTVFPEWDGITVNATNKDSSAFVLRIGGS
jgi:hypothetical protein